MGKTPIRIAIVGVGNCASSLVQGIEFYRNKINENPKYEPLGLMHLDIGGYRPSDIEVGAAFDIDRRKVGRPLREAIFARPNCTKTIFPTFNDSAVTVSMGEVLDGVSDHMKNYPEERIFVVADQKPCDVERVLKDSGVDILLNYLPVGSEQATQYYAQACMNTGVSLINCMPSFIVSDRQWAKRFEAKGIPVVGDDVKSQMGATIIHRTLAKLFEDRGVRLDRTYQINTGGNTDFLNMLNQTRLKSKRISKTEAIQSQLEVPLEPENIHIGPSDYVPWQNDNKICFLRMEGRGFGEIPLNLELRLSVEDSPNSGGMTIDAIRCCQIARERGTGGPLLSISAYAMKHPLVQYADTQARTMVEEFIQGKRER
jgi:myo-inositol-1-phosphate synthase